MAWSTSASGRVAPILISLVLALTSVLVASPTASAVDEWTEVGDPINGVTSNALAGYSTDLSDDGSIVVVGAPYESGGTVRAYEWSGTEWIQRGSTLSGSSGDFFGWSVSISGSGDDLAVGAPQNAAAPGYTQVYRWNGTDWTPRGSAIPGRANADGSGYDIALSDDGDTVVMGAPTADSNGSNSGEVSTFGWDGSSWSRLGSVLVGDQSWGYAGVSVAISSDGGVIAFGAYAANSFTGRSQVFVLSGSSWIQRGSDISGGTASAQEGIAIALSSDGSVLAVGANNAGSTSGSARSYDWDGVGWNARPVLDGTVAGGYFGYSVDLSSSGDALVVGASTANASAGQTFVFDFDGTAWAQRGATIDGAAAGDRAGFSVAMSADGYTIASGYSESTNAGGTRAGQVRVFSWPVPPATGDAIPGPETYFSFFLPDGRECTAISPMRVQVGRMVELPGVDANCRTTEGSTVAGWTIPVPLGFTGYGSESQPFVPGIRVRVIESQRFTLVPFEPILRVDFDSNIAADDACVPSNADHTSDDGRIAHVWVPRADHSMARTPLKAACSPTGHDLVGWNTRGDGTGVTLGLGDALPAGWATDVTNLRTLYAMWQAA